jgi:copper oxidase (laccase) domain-containing protein
VFDTFLEAGMLPDWLSEWLSVAPAPAQAEGIGLGAEARARGRGVPGKFYLNTWQANADQLAGAGVPRAQIHVSGLCTACYPELLHSYRVDGARAGRMVGAIRGVAKP